MDFSIMTTEQIEYIIKLLQDIYHGKNGFDDLPEKEKNAILKELRDAKLEHILNR